ncbi:uncharacterized protein METZ01_LOCUS491484 [marine metagenome]|uniref:Uncharacterized protein n=1 Tax=marine metagenome TaxID=408172 RepID=A0A383D2V0_9ZZZZ
MIYRHLALRDKDGRTLRDPMPDFQQKQRILYASQCGNWHNIQLAFVLGL